MTDTHYPKEGSCQCGNVTYRLLAEPIAIFACHCKQCQTLSTSAYSITAVVKPEDLEVTGELKQWERIAESGNKNYAKFCPGCGNRIYHYNPDAPETLKLKQLSSLSDTSWIKPAVHVWVSQKQDWVEIPEWVTQHEKQP